MEVTLIREPNPEVQAAKMSLASRTLTPIGKLEMDATQAAAFHRKWTVGAGHITIADLASVAFEVTGVTRLAGVHLEDARLAGYMEASTRYIEFGPEALFVPDGLDEKLGWQYREVGLGLFETYAELLGEVQEWALVRGMNQPYYWVDICRFLLPRGTRVKVSVAMDVRELAHTLGKMFVSRLIEVTKLASTIHGTAFETAPNLLDLMGVAEYRIQLRRLLEEAVEKFGWGIEVPEGPYVDLVMPDEDANIQFLALCLYPELKLSFREVQRRVGALPKGERKDLLGEILALLSPTRTIRALELIDSSVFDVCVDWGAYYDLKRHRMCTTIPQRNGTELGFLVPRPIVEIGGRERYEKAIRSAERVHRSIAERVSPEVAEYIATNAHLKRFLMGMNLREILYVIWRRSGEGGHFSYRWVAARMHELASKVWPNLMSASQLRCPPSEELAKEYFAFGRY